MYKTHTLDEYEQVMILRGKGWSLPQIFSFLSQKGVNISYGAISDWIYTSKKPFQEKILSKISQQPKFLTTEKSYILGVLCGDGYLRIRESSGQYLVGLNVIDEDFANEFRSALEKVYGLLPTKHIKKTKSTNVCAKPKLQYVISLTSKRAVQDLLKYSSSFKTKEWIVPEEVFHSPLEVKAAFIRGLFDSEGCVSLKKPHGIYLYVCSGNKEPLLKIQEILSKDFDMHLRACYDGCITRLKSSGYENVKNFYERINFTIKRKKDILRVGLSTYMRKGVKRYSLEFKKNALKLLEIYKDVRFVSQLLDTSNANLYDWKNGKYMMEVKNESELNLPQIQ